MKQTRTFLFARFSPILGLVLLLSSCAPTPGLAPSGALKEQLYAIKQQQQEQTLQLQQLQQQLSQLQQRLAIDQTTSTAPQDNQETLEPLEPLAYQTLALPKIRNQLPLNQEVVNIAASASSYLAAFSSLAGGRMLSAEAGFEQFIRDFPAHQYSPNARYWLASAQWSQGKINPAIANLRQIIIDPNAQTKAPAALTQLAQIYRQQGLLIQADNILEQLRNHYPESPEAQQIYRGEEPPN